MYIGIFLNHDHVLMKISILILIILDMHAQILRNIVQGKIPPLSLALEKLNSLKFLQN